MATAAATVIPNEANTLQQIAFVLCPHAWVAVCTQGTAFTYQGRYTDSSNLADGVFDMQSRLFEESRH